MCERTCQPEGRHCGGSAYIKLKQKGARRCRGPHRPGPAAGARAGPLAPAAPAPECCAERIATRRAATCLRVARARRRGELPAACCRRAPGACGFILIHGNRKDANRRLRARKLSSKATPLQSFFPRVSIGAVLGCIPINLKMACRQAEAAFSCRESRDWPAAGSNASGYTELRAGGVCLRPEPGGSSPRHGRRPRERTGRPG